jgi:hypothetical protein
MKIIRTPLGAVNMRGATRRKRKENRKRCPLRLKI